MTFTSKIKSNTCHKKRFLSLAERYCKKDNVVICHQKATAETIVPPQNP
jgi:hypothetical protein